LAERDKPVVIGITGASGSIYAKKILEVLNELEFKVFAVFSKTGKEVFKYELEIEPEEFVGKLRNVEMIDSENLFASISSGSFPILGMAVIPCSMNTLSCISKGVVRNLIHRTAEVCLKERKPLVLVPREFPLNKIHIENMLSVVEAGAVLIPASRSFYSKPKTIEELVMTVIDRVLVHLTGENFNLSPAWTQGTQ